MCIFAGNHTAFIIAKEKRDCKQVFTDKKGAYAPRLQVVRILYRFFPGILRKTGIAALGICLDLLSLLSVLFVHGALLSCLLWHAVLL